MPAVGRLESARQNAAFGQEQVCDSYSNRPRLAPVRLTGWITGEPTSASGWAT